MISKGQTLPHAGSDFSGQHGIASVICIDGEVAAMAMAGAFAVPAANPMIARIESKRLRMFSRAMAQHLTGAEADARCAAITIGSS